MPSLLDDEDDELPGSHYASSENGMDEAMRDVDDEAEADPEAEADVESVTNSSFIDPEGQSRRPVPNPEIVTTGPSPPSPAQDQSALFRPTVRPETLTAATYDIVPTIAAPHSTSVNAVTATADMRWVFSGGSDGYVRKFNWADSVNSKLMLTVAQRHPFVDSVIKAGVLMNYWENMDGSTLSPVYSLAAQADGLWLLSGLESGNIRLQSIRHDEGKEVAMLRQHSSAVSVLSLTRDEQSLISGSWDKKILEWDLDTGKVKRTFGTSVGQVSAVEFRPESSLPLPRENLEQPAVNGISSQNHRAPALSNQNLSNGDGIEHKDIKSGSEQQPASPADSLFEADSLFGDDEFSQALPNGAQQQDKQSEAPRGPGRPSAAQGPNGVAAVAENSQEETGTDSTNIAPPPTASQEPLANGISFESSSKSLPHAADDLELSSFAPGASQISQNPESNSSSSDAVFLSASIDGAIRVWDRRQPDPVARISPHNCPPWCMSACWSPDGNYIYAGRRNGTVEEYSVHKGLRTPERIFKFPHGSGPVSALKPMPNGRHLVCASHDILRLYDLKEPQSSRSTVPFLVIPGHRTGAVSQLYMDAPSRFLISTGGNRGWDGSSTEVLLGYEIGVQ